MIKKIRNFFNKSVSLGEKSAELESEKRIQVAACSLFVEMAGIDNEFSGEERERIIAIITKEFEIDSATAGELMELAALELKGSADLWQFTNLINENYSPEDKTRLMEMIWKVVYADGKLDKHEDYLVKKVAKLLHLRHSEMIDAKLKVLGRKPAASIP